MVAFLLSISDNTMPKPNDLLQGTLNLLILKILELEPLHGWALAQRLKQMSNDVLQVGPGSLYPALHKLEQEGWITATWSISETQRRVKFYTLTKEGRKQLNRQTASWKRLSLAVNSIVLPAEG
jgi:PadR family transcriptional regulator, regulatory protein PadR